ncbi:MAG TPA: hypothetical protein VMS54_00670 [Vicinamibacterales bacterium]|nr:hypothetical protein [Vicinamibacterales bacterium]
MAQATAFNVFTNPGVAGGGFKFYSLSDTAASLAGASLLVGNRAASITATDAATVAQAAVIDAFTNTGPNSFALADTAAHLVAAPTLLANQASGITVTDLATVLQASAIRGFAPLSKIYSLADTVGALFSAPPVANGAVNLTVTDAATVAQAIAIDAFTNSGVNHFNLLSDTGANLTALGVGVQANQAVNIVVTGAPVTVAQAGVIDAYTNTGTNSYVLSDTAANLALATATVGHGASNIIATTAATVAQAIAIDAFTNAGAKSFSIADTAANLAAAPALVASHATNITATTPVSVAQAASIELFTPSGLISYTLSDTAAHLATAPAAVLTGATSISVTDGVTVAQAVAGGLTTASNYGLSDTAANLAAATFDTAHRPSVINATGPVTVAQLDAIHLYKNPGALTLLGLSDTAANLAAAIKVAPAVPDPALADARSFTVTTAASVAQADAIHAYNAISAQALYALSDTAANVVAAINRIDPALTTASSVAVTDPATVAQGNTIHAFNALATYALTDTASALLLAPFATVHSASSVTANGALSAANATTLMGEVTLPSTFHYTLSDSAAALVAAAPAVVTGATSVTVSGAANVAQASTIHGEAPLATYALTDTAAALAAAGLNAPATVHSASSVAVSSGTLLAAEAGTLLSALATPATPFTFTLSDTGAHLAAVASQAAVHAASGITTTGPMLVAEATTVVSELATPATPFAYSLADTSTNLLAATTVVAGAHLGPTPVTVTNLMTVLEAATVHTALPLAAYSIADTATTLASSLSNLSPNLGLVGGAATIDVGGPLTASALVLNDTQFHNLLLAGHPLLALNDTIAVDGTGTTIAAPVNLGVLTDFGGNDVAGMVLGGSNNASYIVDLGTSGVAKVTMQGTGHQQITAHTGGTPETFLMGATATGGSIIGNLQSNDLIDILGVNSSLSNKAVTAVTKATDWSFDGHLLTWWDSSHAQAETLTLNFAGNVAHTLSVNVDKHTFTVI